MIKMAFKDPCTVVNTTSEGTFVIKMQEMQETKTKVRIWCQENKINSTFTTETEV